MKILHQKDIRVLLFVLLATTALASLPEAEPALTRVKEVYREQDFGLRTLREAMLVALASQQGDEDPAGFDGRISEGGRLVWKMAEPSLPDCCGIHGRDRRQGAGPR